MGITPEMIQRVNIPDKGTLINIKYNFRTRFENLMTNILKIALTRDEDKLSSIIISYYEVSLDEDMLIKALA